MFIPAYYFTSIVPIDIKTPRGRQITDLRKMTSVPCYSGSVVRIDDAGFKQRP